MCVRVEKSNRLIIEKYISDAFKSQEVNVHYMYKYRRILFLFLPTKKCEKVSQGFIIKKADNNQGPLFLEFNSKIKLGDQLI